MDEETEAAVAEAESYATRGLDRLISTIGERLGGRASAKAVFGEPVERDGVTVIPVAKVRYGFGGGGGGGMSGSSLDDLEEAPEMGEGGGGGGGMMASPVGYIEITKGGAHFEPIRDPASVWPLVVASGVAAWLSLRGLRALFR
jgi:uncharacterized spore protein YtfJ